MRKREFDFANSEMGHKPTFMSECEVGSLVRRGVKDTVDLDDIVVK